MEFWWIIQYKERAKPMTNEELIISLQKQTRKDITSLAKSVSRTNSRVAANGVKLDSVIEYNKKCDGRLGDLEEWKATNVGFTAGRDKKAGVFNNKVTLTCTVLGIALGIAGFWYSIVSPALEVKAEVIERLESIEQVTKNLIGQEFLK